MKKQFYCDEDEIKRKSKYKSPDDMLRTIPGVDPNRHKRGIVGFAAGISGFIIAFLLSVWAWMASLCFVFAGLMFTLSQRKIKRTKISSFALIINVTGMFAFAALIALYYATDLFKGI